MHLAFFHYQLYYQHDNLSDAFNLKINTNVRISSSFSLMAAWTPQFVWNLVIMFSSMMWDDSKSIETRASDHLLEWFIGISGTMMNLSIAQKKWRKIIKMFFDKNKWFKNRSLKSYLGNHKWFFASLQKPTFGPLILRVLSLIYWIGDQE